MLRSYDIVVEKPNEIFSKVAIADLPIIDSMSIRGVLYDTDLSILEKCVSLKYLDLSNAYIMESPRTVEERNAKNAEIGAIFALIGAVAESEYNRGQISVVDNVIAQSLADATSSLLDIKEASKESIVPTSAFSGMKELKEVRLPMTASAIRGSAFAGCSNLEKVDMPPYATSIGSSAFANCSSLVEIKLPSSVTSIGSKAFLNCTSLKVLNMPKSLNKLGDAAFSSCSSLKEIDLSNCQLKGSIDMNIFGSSYHGDHYTGHIILPNEIDHITNSFHPRYSQTITFNHKLKEIKKGSFKGGTLYFNGATPPILRDCSISNCTIYVPKGSSTAYYMEYGASNKYIEQ